jgi:membrane protein YdbS with pleckstrin-like domain
VIGAVVARLRPFFEPLLKLRLAPPHLPEGSDEGRALRPAAQFLTYRYLGVLLTAAVESLPVVILGGLALWKLRLLGLVVAVPLVLLFLGAVGIALVATRLDWELRHYVIGSRSLRLRAGAWVQREITLSYANVQNVELMQGPIERLFGFKSLRISTAGGSRPQKDKLHLGGSHDAVLLGITNAEEIRELIMSALRRRRDAGLGDADDAGAATVAESRAELLAGVLAAARELRAAAEARRAAG